MTNAFIIHGTIGSPDENWFPWLKARLEKLGCWVYVPRFPTPEKQSVENWMKVFENYERHVNGDTIFVGHSLGAIFILSLLETLKCPLNCSGVKAAFLVAGFYGKLGTMHFDKINADFASKDFDWAKVRRSCRQFQLYASDNDPYVPFSKSVELAKKLGAGLKVIKDAGHFNRDAGYTRFDLLLEDIKKVIQ